MYPVIYINCDMEKQYNSDTFFTHIKDKFKTKVMDNTFISELGLTVTSIRLPPNFNSKAFSRNLESSRKYAGTREAVLAPHTLRVYDYKFLNRFQRELLAYGIVKSIQLLLRINGKNISNSCIVIYGNIRDALLDVLFELAKRSRYIVLLLEGAEDMEKMNSIRDKIAADYGIVPVITNDVIFALREAEFIVSAKDIGHRTCRPVWYIDNGFIPQGSEGICANDITFWVPWDTRFHDMDTELLGAILSQMGEKDVERSLGYNGIYLDKIKFNNKILGTQI